MSGLPDLRNQFFFPCFSSLPLDAGFLTLYDDSDDDFIAFDKSKPRFQNRSPRKHWCIFAEIVQENQWPIRPVYQVKDLSGRQSLVSFNFDDRSLFVDVARKCKVGYTLCIMYAERHQFADGNEGVRVEQPDAVKVLPVSLRELLATSDVFRASIKATHASTDKAVCSNCNKPAAHRCSRCSLSEYCSKECQTQHWAKKHQKDCQVLRQLKLWNAFDWHRFCMKYAVYSDFVLLSMVRVFVPIFLVHVEKCMTHKPMYSCPSLLSNRHSLKLLLSVSYH
ncbi:hypothetical protein F5050DRAFT_542576 [Lentinula boryana]|uniref:MYND-type domain-containing protein n=1 Tax=Lentinula boryana TaxID=40481 RepID=A0ABQ8Q744_9AGAR|nr:hypothetical protein F5050DRAFT_542576 [Lentinula boryana]